MSTLKKLRPGEIRFEAREEKNSPRITEWNIYDRSSGSYPSARPGIGDIKQGHRTKEAAESEIERLNEFYGLAVSKALAEST